MGHQSREYPGRIRESALERFLGSAMKERITDNVISNLGEREQEMIRGKLQRAYQEPDYDAAKHDQMNAHMKARWMAAALMKENNRCHYNENTSLI